MPNTAESVQAITDTVHRYIATVVNGSADDLADFYADDATLEDPVGGEVHIGTRAIRGFYSAVTGLERECELVTLRVSGHEAAFHFQWMPHQPSSPSYPVAMRISPNRFLNSLAILSVK